ncbi:MAG: DUF4917 family protein [Hyphomicrobiales bacterium]
MTIDLEIKTFNQCLELCVQGKKKHLMLGNGFSMDLFPDIFNYRTLAENIESEHIKQLFEKIETNDFEFIMRRLFEAGEIVEHYPNSDDISEALHEDLEELKNTLIQVISSSHPSSPNEITEEQYECCRQFLSNFDGKKYTFNYDLLLYWVYMHFKDDQEKKLECDDGFRYGDIEVDLSVFWEIGRERKQNLYYLHGAMHIFSDGADIEKLSYNNTGERLSEQVRNAVSNDKFPVFISEGTTDHKLSRIKKNAYLARAFSSIKSIGGNLFIFGHSIRDEDDHIFDYLNEKNTAVKKVFISLFGDMGSLGNQIIIQKVTAWAETPDGQRKDYYFYDAHSVSVWS